MQATTTISPNTLAIGKGIYTLPEVAKILRMPYHKVYTWVNKYWDGELGEIFETNYSWKVENSRAVNFHTLVEFYVFILLAEAGVHARKALEAHKELSVMYDTPFPLAQKEVLEGIRTDGKKIFFETKNGTIALDGKKQFQLDFIRFFFKNLEFDTDLLANKFFPIGKEKNIIIDPKRQFGHPVIGDTNIYPETIYNLHKAGEPTKFIAHLYDIQSNEVEAAIEYCQAA